MGVWGWKSMGKVHFSNKKRVLCGIRCLALYCYLFSFSYNSIYLVMNPFFFSWDIHYLSNCVLLWSHDSILLLFKSLPLQKATIYYTLSSTAQGGEEFLAMLICLNKLLLIQTHEDLLFVEWDEQTQPLGITKVICSRKGTLHCVRSLACSASLWQLRVSTFRITLLCICFSKANQNEA